jgi:hypothetical protein
MAVHEWRIAYQKLPIIQTISGGIFGVYPAER